MRRIDALTFEHVSKRYRGSRSLALDDVCFSIPVGARTCLLGPNGAGKSTSIRLLEGAIQPTAGNVSLLGAGAQSAAYLEARRRTGIVPQGPGVYRDLTAREYLGLARQLYARGDVQHIAEALSIVDELDKPLAQLSGGMQRRVVLATALLAEPDVLLLDEPTVGLDPLATHEVHTMLQSAMHTRDRTTLLCTHNLAEAEALCDEVIILRTGKVLVHAPLADLRRRARPRLRLQARQGRAALVTALRRYELEAEPENDRQSVLVSVRDPASDAPDLLRGLLNDGLDVFVCEPVQVGLETLFLDLVRSS